MAKLKLLGLLPAVLPALPPSPLFISPPSSSPKAKDYYDAIIQEREALKEGGEGEGYYPPDWDNWDNPPNHPSGMPMY